MVALAHAEIADPGLKALVESLMAQPHLRIQGIASGNRAAACARALLPVVHIVLLKSARGTEASDASQTHGCFHLRGGGLIDIDPRPHLGFLRSARVPD